MIDSLPDMFKRLTAGVYLIGVGNGGVRNAFTASWVMQVSFDPLLLALSIDPSHASYPLMVQGGGFSVNVLKREQLAIAARYGDPARPRGLPDLEWGTGGDGRPVFRDALAWFECRLLHECEAGDHRLALGQVTGCELLEPGAQPLTYAETGNVDGAAALFPKSLRD